MGRVEIEHLMEQKPQLRDKLFARGFLFTNETVDSEAYPFYGLWEKVNICGATLLVSHQQSLYIHRNSEYTMILVGHAYNPFTMESSENTIIKELCSLFGEQREKFMERFNQLTGVFALMVMHKEIVEIYGDCAGMQAIYYGYVSGKLYISSHMQLIGDLCDLRPTDYVLDLIQYRFFKFYGAYLPANISKYNEIKRVTPNTKVCCRENEAKIERFYPTAAITIVDGDDEYSRRISEICDILHKNMTLIAQKWRKPAISMTGGMDSKATVAASNGLNSSFLYFSYDSMRGERVDADAAHKIAEALNVEHRIDVILDNDSLFCDLGSVKAILEHNNGYIGKNNPNDIRKRIYYAQEKRFDIEVKSWVSEIGRANYYKKFGRKKMPYRLSPRQMSCLYKLFINKRSLLKRTDNIFHSYIQETSSYEIFNFDASDMFLWEVRYGSWGGHVITDEHRFSFDITIPYNNRKLMELFLTLPLEKRISDQVHRDIVYYLDNRISETGIEITNYNETKKRMILEKMYFFFNTHAPF